MESLRYTEAQLLEGQGRYAELVDYLSGWVKENPESSSPYSQYLSALIRTDQMDRANALMARWLREGQAAGELSPAVIARVQAAIQQALGQGHNLYTGRIEPRWLSPLGDAALSFVHNDDRLSLANMILSGWQFQQTDEVRRVRKALLDEMRTGSEKMSPARMESYLQWVSTAEASEWKSIGAGLLRHWSAEADVEKKHQLGRLVVQVLSRQNDPPALLAFLHTQWRKGPKSYRSGYAGELFETLLTQPWSAEYEDEAFTLLGKLSETEDEGRRLRARVAALYRLTDRMIEARRAAKMKTVEHPEKLTRVELKKKQDEILRQARAGFAERLRAAAAKERGPLAPWLKVERLYLLTLFDRDLRDVAAECWKHLDAEPTKKKAAAAEPESVRPLDDVSARALPDDADVPGRPQGRRRRPHHAIAAIPRPRHRAGGRGGVLEASPICAADRARPPERAGKGASELGPRRRRGQPLASGARLRAGRAGTHPRSDRTAGSD